MKLYEPASCMIRCATCTAWCTQLLTLAAGEMSPRLGGHLPPIAVMTATTALPCGDYYLNKKYGTCTKLHS